MWYKSTEMLYKITRFCTKFCTKSHDFVRALSGVKQINTYLISKRPCTNHIETKTFTWVSKVEILIFSGHRNDTNRGK